MSLRRSERHKMSSLEVLSDAKEQTSTRTQATSTRKRRDQPAQRDRAEPLLGITRAPEKPSKLFPPSTRKRKLEDFQDEKPSKTLAATPQHLNPTRSSATVKPKSESKPKNDGTEKSSVEKRLRRYRDKAPQSFLEKLHRAQTQR